MKSYKVAGFFGVALISTIMFAGCSSVDTTPEKAPQQEKLNAQELVKKTVDTVCTLSGKKILQSEDIRAFKDMAIQLNKYEGKESSQMQATAAQLESFANTYELVLGIELDDTTTRQFVTGCDNSQKLYAQTYPQ